MTDIVRRTSLRGEVLPKVVVTVRQDGGFDAPWRVFSTAPQDRGRALSQNGKLLGGTWTQACNDADRLRTTHGFHFERPSGLQLPSRTPNV